jgi:hypothetical protein
MAKESKVYLCEHVVYEEKGWDQISPIPLTDVVTGEAVQEETLVKACWDSDAFYVRFECVDSYCISDYKNRNDPLFEQDVVEVFIDEDGEGKRYAEIVVSPHNIIFDAMITHDNEDDPLEFAIHSDWETKGLVTNVDASRADKRIYTLKIPFTNFERMPSDGTEWRINFYRIDEEPSGIRHYQAWSPIGIINYHVADLFGKLQFRV